MMDDVTRRKSTINSSYTTVEKKTKHVTDIDSGSEQYSLDDMPRVTKLNDADVQSLDSALISAEEQDLAESSPDFNRSRNGKQPRYQQRTTDLDNRRVSNIRRQSAINVARRISTAFMQDSRDDEGRLGSERRISIVGSDRDSISTPGGVRRNVSAFGEITVMPVGEKAEERPRVAVDEEFIG